MRRIKWVGVFVLCLSVLGGCAIAPQQGNFACPIDQIAGCLDVTSADYMQNKTENTRNIKGAQRKALHSDINQGLVYRTRETTRRIWFAPYEDKEGNWHEANFVYVVDKPAIWQVVSVKPNIEPKKEPSPKPIGYEWEGVK